MNIRSEGNDKFAIHPIEQALSAQKTHKSAGVQLEERPRRYRLLYVFLRITVGMRQNDLIPKGAQAFDRVTKIKRKLVKRQFEHQRPRALKAKSGKPVQMLDITAKEHLGTETNGGKRRRDIRHCRIKRGKAACAARGKIRNFVQMRIKMRCGNDPADADMRGIGKLQKRGLDRRGAVIGARQNVRMQIDDRHNRLRYSCIFGVSE